MACLNDDQIGPFVVGCRDDFDFTKTFEQLAFSIVPNILFLGIAMTSMAHLGTRPAESNNLSLVSPKSLTAYSLLGIHSVYLYSRTCDGSDGSRYAVAAASIATVASVALVFFSRLVHTRTSKPSDTITIFLFVSILCDTVQLRTNWLGSSSAHVTGLLAAIVTSKFSLLLLELRGKSVHLKPQDTSEAKEVSCSAIGRLFLYWMNDLVRYGYGHKLCQEALYPLDESLAAEKCGNRFMIHYRLMQTREEKQNANIRGWKVVHALVWTLGTSCVAPVVPRITIAVFGFAHPFFIDSILDNLSHRALYLPTGTVVAYIGIIFFLNVGSAMATSAYWCRQEEAIAQVRSSLIPAVYQKTIRRKIYSDQNSSVISLINSEINMIQSGIRAFHDFWICLFEIMLASWLLKRRIGWAFLAPLAVVIVCAGVSAAFGRFTVKSQNAWMVALGSRVGLTSTVIPNLPSIKMAGLGHQIGRVVQLAREQEIALANRFRILSTLSATISFTPMVLCPIVTFTVASGSLTMTEVMASLALINLLSSPLIQVLQALPSIMGAVTSIKRVEDFLDSENDDGLVAEPYQNEICDTDELDGLELIDASFGWQKNNWSVRDINLAMAPGTFNYVVGPVASGKTTLCLGLLGEVRHSKGQVKLSRRKQLSYCHQDPFIINGTIRENIIGFAPFNAELYQKVVRACQLQADFEAFPHGDATIVGSEGAALSGGQKKRISLARALVAEPKVSIFDDVLSGIDSQTAQRIVHDVFGPDGILRKSRCIVVFTSQSNDLAEVFDKALVLQNGSVIWNGSASKLLDEDCSKSAAPPAISSSHIGCNMEIEDVGMERNTAPQGDSATLPMVQPGHHDDYGLYFDAVGPWMFATFCLLAVGATFLYTFSTLWLETWIAAEESPAKKKFYLWAFWALQIICLMSVLAYFAFTSNVMGPKASSKLHFGALKAILLAPLDYYTTVDSSVPTGYMAQDMSIIDNQFTNSIGNTTASSLMSFFQSLVIAIASPVILVGYPFFFAILFCVQQVFVKTSVQLRALDMEGRNPINKHFMETLGGLVTIRAFGWSASNTRLNAKLLDKSQQSSYLSAMLQTWLKLMLNLCVALLASIFVGVASQLSTSPGLVGVALVTFMSVGELMVSAVQSYASLQTSAVVLKRLQFLQDSVLSEEKLGRTATPPEIWPAEGVVRMTDASAAYITSTPYPGKSCRLVESGNPDDAIKNMSLQVKKGEKVLICGRTGSGKSTLLRILQGFIVPYRGVVTIDGVTPTDVDRNRLRDSVIALPQTPFFLPSEYSVRDNIEHHSSSKDFTLEDIQEKRQQARQDEDCIYALQTVGLWESIYERGGLDAPLIDGSLSSGQKQLFSLARAIVRQRLKRQANQATALGGEGLLLLDEFNTGLDATTESRMWEMIKTEFASSTIICVAHRLGAALDFDQVCVISNGRIAEQGVPARLLEDPTSKFRALWSLRDM